MKKTPALIIAGAAISSLLLVGCGGSDSGSGSDSASTEPLQFLLSGDTNQGGGYAAMAKKYKEETGVQVDVVDIAYEDLMTKLRNAAQAGDLPALARASSVDPLWADGLQDLSDIATETKVMPSLLQENDKGEIPALPSDVTAVGLFINKTLFDQAGVAYPTTEDDIWTWTEYIDALKLVQERTGAKYGMVMDPSAHRLRSLLFQFGSNGFENEDGTFSANAATKRGMEFFKSINDDKIMPRSVWLSGDDPNALFKSGQVAAYYSGVWQVTDFTKNIKDFEWASVYMPYEEHRATNLGGNYIVGFTGTGQDEAAKKFIAWLYDPVNYAELCEISGFLPVEPGLDIQYPAGKASYDLYNLEIAASDPISSQQITGDIDRQLHGLAVEGDPIKNETIKMLNDEESVDEAIDNIVSQFTEQLTP